MTDLTGILDDIIDVMQSHGIIKPAIAIAFTSENEKYQECHWMTNVTRKDGITLFRDTADKMLDDTFWTSYLNQITQ